MTDEHKPKSLLDDLVDSEEFGTLSEVAQQKIIKILTDLLAVDKNDNDFISPNLLAKLKDLSDLEPGLNLEDSEE